MIKIFALGMIVSMVAASATTLAESGDYKFTIKFSMNSSNNSNSDVQLGLKVGSTSQPLTNSYYATGACVNVAMSNYQLSTASTSLKGFGIEWWCSSTCTSLAAVYNSVKYYGGMNWGQDTSHVVSLTSSTEVTSPTGTDAMDSGDKKVTHTFSGLTPTMLASTMYLPNMTETWYVRCFANFNHASSMNLAGSIANLESSLGNGKNLSLKGSGFQVAAILAVAGSLVASLA